jgi:hypothetical protein
MWDLTHFLSSRFLQILGLVINLILKEPLEKENKAGLKKQVLCGDSDDNDVNQKEMGKYVGNFFLSKPEISHNFPQFPPSDNLR